MSGDVAVVASAEFPVQNHLLAADVFSMSGDVAVVAPVLFLLFGSVGGWLLAIRFLQILSVCPIR